MFKPAAFSIGISVLATRLQEGDLHFILYIVITKLSRFEQISQHITPFQVSMRSHMHYCDCGRLIFSRNAFPLLSLLGVSYR